MSTPPVLNEMYNLVKDLDADDVNWLARMWCSFRVTRDWRNQPIWPLWYLGPDEKTPYATSADWTDAWSSETNNPWINAIETDLHDNCPSDKLDARKWLLANIQRHYVLGQHRESALYRYALRERLNTSA